VRCDWCHLFFLRSRTYHSTHGQTEHGHTELDADVWSTCSCWGFGQPLAHTHSHTRCHTDPVIYSKLHRHRKYVFLRRGLVGHMIEQQPCSG
jgi:hypothetical protein